MDVNNPASYPIHVYRGDTWSMKVTILDSAQEPVDLTGDTIAAQVRGCADGPLLLDLVVTIDDPTSGVVVLSLPPDAVLNGDPMVWDLQRTSAAGLVRTLLRGRLTATPDVTR